MKKQASTSIWILGDQLLETHPALTYSHALAAPDATCVVLIESDSRFARHPYHKKKVVLLKSAMQHYAERLRQQGYSVDYRRAPNMAAGLRGHVSDYQPDRIVAMEASEYAGRKWQRERMKALLGVSVEIIPNTQFLVGTFDPYPQSQPDRHYLMEHFYRKMRRHFDVLMDGEQPVGGVWNYDKQNRRPYPRNAVAPARARFTPDTRTTNIIEAVKTSDAFGQIEEFALAVTHEQAAAALQDFIAQRLARFGDYEDAMAARDGQLYHSFLSPYLNIGLLEPMQVIRAAEAAYAAGVAPINAVEGLIRQVLGWREFIYWQYWRQMPGILNANAWNASQALPEFFWTGESAMNCMRHILRRVRQDGYVHHIERLMVLANFSTLAGLHPISVNNWFLSTFVDAYEWVMIPNVLGMGLNADGGKIATKPYIASAHYIKRMSDYCANCPFDYAKRTGNDACPFNFLYWNFLIEHEERLRANPRFGPAVLGLRNIDPDERKRIKQQALDFLHQLGMDSKNEQ
ncbi:MAG: cryptochrome/photolyase family protein [Chloroflexi bacterium]|nr:cryptochrome/photolyase family protein [Chloroflexota bacterium]